jgi:hypothetical protein
VHFVKSEFSPLFCRRFATKLACCILRKQIPRFSFSAVGPFIRNTAPVTQFIWIYFVQAASKVLDKKLKVSFGIREIFTKYYGFSHLKFIIIFSPFALEKLADSIIFVMNIDLKRQE